MTLILFLYMCVYVCVWGYVFVYVCTLFNLFDISFSTTIIFYVHTIIIVSET